MTAPVSPTSGSWAFRLGAVALGIVALPFALAIAVGLTGGALLAPSPLSDSWLLWSAFSICCGDDC